MGQSVGSAEHPGWTQWDLEDSWRVELPLSSSNDDTFPVGMAISTSNQIRLGWNDNETLDAMPILLVLSTDGALCCYHVINMLPGAVTLTHAAEELTSANERRGNPLGSAHQLNHCRQQWFTNLSWRSP